MMLTLSLKLLVLKCVNLTKYNLNYKTLMPCNLYGSGDNYDLKKSHFYPALIRKIFTAKIQGKKDRGMGNRLPKRIYAR